MKQQITGSKLERLIYLLENHSNAKVLGDALLAKNITDATAVQVKEVGGSHLEFRFKLPTDTDTSWLKKRAIRITKKFIDDFNEAAQEAYDEAVANNENPEELDLDSDETKIAIGTAWIRQSVKGNSKDIDVDDDKVEIIALSGKIDQTNFLIEVQEAGLITDHGKKYQLRLKSARTNISTVFPTDPITVTSLNHSEIRQQLIAALELPEVVEDHESEVKRLFEEDILLQMTHYKVGGRYVAIVSNAALDYYGEIQFSVVEETEEPEEPENPGPTYPLLYAANYDTDNGVVSSDGTDSHYNIIFEFDPETEMLEASSPDLSAGGDLFSVLKVSVSSKDSNGASININDFWSGGHSRQVAYNKPFSTSSYDNTLTAFNSNDYLIVVTGDVVTVRVIGTSEDPEVVENREYTVEGIGVPTGQKLHARLQLTWHPEQLQNIADLNSLFKIVPKVQK